MDQRTISDLPQFSILLVEDILALCGVFDRNESIFKFVQPQADRVNLI